MIIKEKCFRHDEQLDFARLSGDYNPIHIDPLIARRLLFGRQLVHGIHLFMWSLDNWFAVQPTEPLTLQRVKLVFSWPVLVDEERVKAEAVEHEKGTITIKLKKDKKIVALFNVSYAGRCTSIKNTHVVTEGKHDRRIPRKLSSDKVKKASGSLSLMLDSRLAMRLFPNITARISSLQIAEILGTTRLVGMECPGLDSIYSGADLNFEEEAGDMYDLKYKVSFFDKRFSLVKINILAPGLKGTINSLLRPRPQKQIGMTKAIEKVEPEEFGERRALVVGGSRGLGELTAKLLAAGGAEVKITYHQGAEDAMSIVDDINSIRTGTAETLKLDVLNPPSKMSELLGKRFVPTHLYYFATPHIDTSPYGTFSPELFRRFCDFYISGFIKIVKSVQALGGGMLYVIYPSTVFIDNLPPNTAEYTAAKAAGEILCTFLTKYDPRLKVFYFRLPKMPTDQTKSLPKQKLKNPIPILLDILRKH